MPTSFPPASPLTAALVAFHQSVGTIHENSKAQYGSYADLPAVLAEILPKLAAQGIRLSQTFHTWGEDGSGMILRTSLKHISGEEEVSDLPLIRASSSRGNPLHDWGGAVTYQRRYAILSILGLAAGISDDDGDAFDASPRQPTKPAAKAPAKSAAAKTEKATYADMLPQAAPLASTEELQGIKAAITGLSPESRNQVVAAFKAQFATPQDHGIADYIKTQEHVEFLIATMNGHAA